MKGLINMLFKELPLGAKKALVQYFAIDCSDESFYEVIDGMVNDKLSESDWSNLVAHADTLWGNNEYSLSCLPIDVATSFIMDHSPDLLEEHASFDDYHFDYCGDGESIPNHSDNSWPVLAMPSCDEALLDGWHRFNAYVRDGFSEIYFINLDEVAISVNSKYMVRNSLKAA